VELTKLKRESAVNAVYQALRQAILSSTIKPGQRLDVEELGQKLGVSLTPVRNAIHQLAAEGLIEIRPRTGTFVASLSPQDVKETFEIRLALESLAAEKAVENTTSADLKRLTELLKSLRKPVRNDEDRKNHERDNVEFHLILVKASGNRRLIEMYEALNAHIKIARIHASERNWPSRLEEEQAEHEEIVNAIEKGDATKLIAALRKHIRRAKDSLVTALNERQ
jgi:DNA-binding GntR family transcriptional regulator